MSSVWSIDPLAFGMAADRLVVYVSSAMIFGVHVFTLLLAREPVGLVIDRRLRTALDAASACLALGTLLWLPLEAAEVQDAWNGAVQRDILGILVLQTNSGRLWMGRCLVVLLLVAVQFAWRDRCGRRVRLLLSTLSLVLLAFAGHGAMHDGALGYLHELNDILHVVSACGWLGSLAGLWVCVGQLEHADMRAHASAALIRFSTAGHVAVVLVLLTGMANTYLVLGDWPFHLGSVYQRLLLTKIALVLGMIALAVINRYVLVPRLRNKRGEAGSANSQIRWLTAFEGGLGIGVLMLVSVLGILDPT